MHRVMVFIDYQNFNINLKEHYKGKTFKPINYWALGKAINEIIPFQSEVLKTYLFAYKPCDDLMKIESYSKYYEWLTKLKKTPYLEIIEGRQELRTYIRTLCHDIGLKLGCGGCMESLKRTRVADFSIEQALTLGEIEKKRDAGELEQILYPTDYVFRALEAVTVQKKYGKILYNGNRIAKEFFVTSPTSDETESVRIYDEEGRFIGIYRYDKRQENYKPVKIFWEQ